MDPAAEIQSGAGSGISGAEKKLGEDTSLIESPFPSVANEKSRKLNGNGKGDFNW